MGMKGKRKFECQDCKAHQMFHPVELARRCKPHCSKCGGTFFEPWSEDRSGEPMLHLHLIHIDPHSGRDRGFPVWYATYGQTGVSGLGCPIQLAAKCCREAARHWRRDAECAKYVIDGDGLATGGKREEARS